MTEKPQIQQEKEKKKERKEKIDPEMFVLCIP